MESAQKDQGKLQNSHPDPVPDDILERILSIAQQGIRNPETSSRAAGLFREVERCMLEISDSPPPLVNVIDTLYHLDYHLYRMKKVVSLITDELIEYYILRILFEDMYSLIHFLDRAWKSYILCLHDMIATEYSSALLREWLAGIQDILEISIQREWMVLEDLHDVLDFNPEAVSPVEYIQLVALIQNRLAVLQAEPVLPAGESIYDFYSAKRTLDHLAQSVEWLYRIDYVLCPRDRDGNLSKMTLASMHIGSLTRSLQSLLDPHAPPPSGLWASLERVFDRLGYPGSKNILYTTRNRLLSPRKRNDRELLEKLDIHMYRVHEFIEKKLAHLRSAQRARTYDMKYC